MCVVTHFSLCCSAALASDAGEKVQELRYRYETIKVKGLEIPEFVGGAEEERMKTKIFSKQASILEVCDKRRPSTDDYLKALNVQLYRLHKFDEYRNHWFEKFPEQEDFRALIAAKAHIHALFHQECLKATNFEEDLIAQLGGKLFEQVISKNPYAFMLKVAHDEMAQDTFVPSKIDLKHADEYRQYVKGVVDSVLQIWKSAEERGAIPEEIRRDLIGQLKVRIEISSFGGLRAKVVETSGSEALDNLAISCAEMYKPMTFPASLKTSCVFVSVVFPVHPSKNGGIHPVSKQELNEFHLERREFDKRVMNAKRIRTRRKNLKPWEDLTPYGDVIQTYDNYNRYK